MLLSRGVTLNKRNIRKVAPTYIECCVPDCSEHVVRVSSFNLSNNRLRAVPLPL